MRHINYLVGTFKLNLKLFRFNNASYSPCEGIIQLFYDEISFSF